MERVNVLYRIRKAEIYGYYTHFDKLDNESIIDANDHIVDCDLKVENFKNELEEFFNTVAICIYMIEHDLYDDYFFEAFNDILEDYDDIKDDFINEEDKELFESDVDTIKDYLLKEEQNKKYYDTLSDVYNREIDE